MNFGEKFRTEHSSLSGSMSKAKLDTYAEKLESKIKETTFDKEHDTLFIKNSTLTKKQIDYLQLKLNIYIFRLDQEKIGLNPFKSYDIEASYKIGVVDFLVLLGLSCIVAILFESLVTSIIPTPMPSTPYTFCLYCVGSLAIFLGVGTLLLMLDIVFNYKDKRYIKALQESNEI